MWQINSHLDLDGPGEVGHVDVEGDVVVKPEVELLTGEAVSVLLNVGPGYDGHLLAWDGPGWWEDRQIREWLRRSKLYRRTREETDTIKRSVFQLSGGQREQRVILFYRVCSPKFSFIVENRENVNSLWSATVLLVFSEKRHHDQVLSEVNESMLETESTNIWQQMSWRRCVISWWGQVKEKIINQQDG